MLAQYQHRVPSSNFIDKSRTLYMDEPLSSNIYCKFAIGQPGPTYNPTSRPSQQAAARLPQGYDQSAANNWTAAAVHGWVGGRRRSQKLANHEPLNQTRTRVRTHDHTRTYVYSINDAPYFESDSPTSMNHDTPKHTPISY